MDCFHVFRLKLLGGWKRINNLALSLKNAGLTLGWWWGLSARKTFTVWLWAWSTVTMAMLVASWSSLRKFFVPSLESISGVWKRLVKEYLGSRYIQGLLDYPNFDVWLRKRCLEELFLQCSGCWTLFRRPNSLWLVSRVLSIVTSCSLVSLSEVQLRQATFSPPGLVDVVSNIIGLWPLIFSYLKETGKKDSGDSLVVCLFLVALFFTWVSLPVSVFVFGKKG